MAATTDRDARRVTDILTHRQLPEDAQFWAEGLSQKTLRERIEVVKQIAINLKGKASPVGPVPKNIIRWLKEAKLFEIQDKKENLPYALRKTSWIFPIVLQESDWLPYLKAESQNKERYQNLQQLVINEKEITEILTSRSHNIQPSFILMYMQTLELAYKEKVISRASVPEFQRLLLNFKEPHSVLNTTIDRLLKTFKEKDSPLEHARLLCMRRFYNSGNENEGIKKALHIFAKNEDLSGLAYGFHVCREQTINISGLFCSQGIISPRNILVFGKRLDNLQMAPLHEFVEQVAATCLQELSDHQDLCICIEEFRALSEIPGTDQRLKLKVAVKAAKHGWYSLSHRLMSISRPWSSTFEALMKRFSMERFSKADGYEQHLLRDFIKYPLMLSCIHYEQVTNVEFDESHSPLVNAIDQRVEIYKAMQGSNLMDMEWQAWVFEARLQQENYEPEPQLIVDLLARSDDPLRIWCSLLKYGLADVSINTDEAGLTLKYQDKSHVIRLGVFEDCSELEYELMGLAAWRFAQIKSLDAVYREVQLDKWFKPENILHIQKYVPATAALILLSKIHCTSGRLHTLKDITAYLEKNKEVFVACRVLETIANHKDISIKSTRLNYDQLYKDFTTTYRSSTYSNFMKSQIASLTTPEALLEKIQSIPTTASATEHSDDDSDVTSAIFNTLEEEVEGEIEECMKVLAHRDIDAKASIQEFYDKLKPNLASLPDHRGSGILDQTGRCKRAENETESVAYKRICDELLVHARAPIDESQLQLIEADVHVMMVNYRNHLIRQLLALESIKKPEKFQYLASSINEELKWIDSIESSMNEMFSRNESILGFAYMFKTLQAHFIGVLPYAMGKSLKDAKDYDIGQRHAMLLLAHLAKLSGDHDNEESNDNPLVPILADYGVEDSSVVKAGKGIQAALSIPQLFNVAGGVGLAKGIDIAISLSKASPIPILDASGAVRADALKRLVAALDMDVEGLGDLLSRQICKIRKLEVDGEEVSALALAQYNVLIMSLAMKLSRSWKLKHDLTQEESSAIVDDWNRKFRGVLSQKGIFDDSALTCVYDPGVSLDGSHRPLDLDRIYATAPVAHLEGDHLAVRSIQPPVDPSMPTLFFDSKSQADRFQALQGQHAGQTDPAVRVFDPDEAFVRMIDDETVDLEKQAQQLDALTAGREEEAVVLPPYLTGDSEEIPEEIDDAAIDQVEVDLKNRLLQVEKAVAENRQKCAATQAELDTVKQQLQAANAKVDTNQAATQQGFTDAKAERDQLQASADQLQAQVDQLEADFEPLRNGARLRAALEIKKKELFSQDIDGKLRSFHRSAEQKILSHFIGIMALDSKYIKRASCKKDTAADLILGIVSGVASGLVGIGLGAAAPFTAGITAMIAPFASIFVLIGMLPLKLAIEKKIDDIQDEHQKKRIQGALLALGDVDDDQGDLLELVRFFSSLVAYGFTSKYRDFILAGNDEDHERILKCSVSGLKSELKKQAKRIEKNKKAPQQDCLNKDDWCDRLDAKLDTSKCYSHRTVHGDIPFNTIDYESLIACRDENSYVILICHLAGLGALQDPNLFPLYYQGDQSAIKTVIGQKICDNAKALRVKSNAKKELKRQLKRKETPALEWHNTRRKPGFIRAQAIRVGQQPKPVTPPPQRKRAKSTPPTPPTPARARAQSSPATQPSSTALGQLTTRVQALEQATSNTSGLRVFRDLYQQVDPRIQDLELENRRLAAENAKIKQILRVAFAAQPDVLELLDAPYIPIASTGTFLPKDSFVGYQGNNYKRLVTAGGGSCFFHAIWGNPDVLDVTREELRRYAVKPLRKMGLEGLRSNEHLCQTYEVFLNNMAANLEYTESERVWEGRDKNNAQDEIYKEDFWNHYLSCLEDPAYYVAPDEAAMISLAHQIPILVLKEKYGPVLDDEGKQVEDENGILQSKPTGEYNSIVTDMGLIGEPLVIIFKGNHYERCMLVDSA